MQENETTQPTEEVQGAAEQVQEQPQETKPFKSFATETEYRNFLAAEKQEAISAAINKHTGETAQRLENDILESTGIEKNEGEKYHQYLKRSIETLKKGSNTDQKILENLELQKQSYESKISDYEKQLSDLRSESSLNQKQMLINSNLSEFTLKNDEVSKVYKEAVINEVKELDFVDSDGSTLLKRGDNFVKDENGNPYTLKGYLASKVKVIQETETLKGTNAGAAQTTVKAVNTLGIVVGQVKDLGELSTKMREEATKKGIATSTKDFAQQVYLEAKERGFTK